MKKLLYIIITIIILSLIPTIPYDNKLESGVIVIEYNSVAELLWKEYRERKVMSHDENQPDEKS